MEINQNEILLTEKQEQAWYFLHDNETIEVLFGGGAGGGKSALGCIWCIDSALRYKGSRGLIGRSQLKTLRETTLQTFFEVASAMRISNRFNYKAPTTITFNNGSEIILCDLFQYPSDPNFDELGSLELTYAFVDEANQITQKAKSILRSRIRYKLDEFGLIPKILYTCNPAKNWTKKEFYDLWETGSLPTDKAFVQALLDDNPHIYSGYRQSLEQLTHIDRERLLYGNWNYDDNEDALIGYDAIRSIFTNTHVPEGTRYITTDIARMGSDKTVIRVWSGWRVLRREQLTKQPLTQVAERIKSIAEEFKIPMSNVLCDEDGVGGGVVDILRCKGFVANKAATEGNYGSLKDQCCYILAKNVNENKVYEQATPEVEQLLIQEFEQLREKNVGLDGKRKVISKDEVKRLINRSPDDLDTYIMRAWFDINRVSVRFVTQMRTTSNRRSDYNI